jgi:hypothetical protein
MKVVKKISEKMDFSKKDKYWKITEKKKNLIWKEVKHNEIDADYDPRKIMKLTFPNLSDEELYKIFCISLLIKEYLESDEDSDNDYDEDLDNEDYED